MQGICNCICSSVFFLLLYLLILLIKNHRYYMVLLIKCLRNVLKDKAQRNLETARITMVHHPFSCLSIYYFYKNSYFTNTSSHHYRIEKHNSSRTLQNANRNGMHRGINRIRNVLKDVVLDVFLQLHRRLLFFLVVF